MSVAELCASQAGFTGVPADQILTTIGLAAEQRAKLDKLKAVAAKVSEELRASCPVSTPPALEARLDAAGQRIEALIQAADALRPAVSDFYASLSDEQKAQLGMRQAMEGSGR